MPDADAPAPGSPHASRAHLRSTEALRVDAFLDADTPGNVGVALSGGGSRALAAGMGQLRALAALREDGRSLLSQVKAIAAVSGGAWLAAPYTYLRGEISDEDFLGVMVPPEELRPVRLPGVEPDAALDYLRPGNIGQVPADHEFSPGAWGLEVLGMTLRYEVPDRMLWQTLIARHVLAPYGLFEGWEAVRGEPASLFSYDAATVERDVLADNPGLAGTPAYLYADRLDPRRDRRPFLICQGALLLTRPGDPFQALAQVQVTPFFAGVVGRPEGVDANGHPVGGAVVTPFAFAGVVRDRAGQALTVEQERPFSLADAVGISSSFFSEAIRNSRAHLSKDPVLRESLESRRGDGPDWLPASVKAELKTKLDAATSSWVESATESDVMQRLSRTEVLVPSYCAVGPGEATGGHALTTFADGGSLDNTGITSLLAYADIDSILSFVSSYERPAAVDHGVLDAAGAELPDSRIFVSGQLPPLFGYQAHRPGIGYRLYAGDPQPVHPELAHNQVFEPAAFAELLRELWRSSGSGAFTAPAAARLRLRVLANPSLGVRGRGGPDDDNPEPITLMLVYTARVRALYDRLHPSVQAIHGDFDDPTTCGNFPFYSTGSTHLGATRVNLLAHLSAFTVEELARTGAIRSLFAPSAMASRGSIRAARR